MLQHNYLNVLSGDVAKATATNTYGIMGHIDGCHLDAQVNVHTVTGTLTYLGKCAGNDESSHPVNPQ
ncbi:hypothetical protein [Halocatena marina]|uniref:Uncharacterized protein n=1 Tax=Halocatena marina TaxID=2934937 RepID=A0ABD5YJ06_9EURY|nr:hypothetical protein [Halocatena marina]